MSRRGRRTIALSKAKIKIHHNIIILYKAILKENGIPVNLPNNDSHGIKVGIKRKGKQYINILGSLSSEETHERFHINDAKRFIFMDK